MRHWLGILLSHRLPLLFCGCALLAGGAIQFYATQRLHASQAELAALQQQASRMQQRLDALRRASSALDGLLVAAPETDQVLAGIAAPHGLRLALEGEQETPSGHWRERRFRLQGPLLHEEILLDILDRWRRQSAFQHQLRHCKLQRQTAELLADCRLALLLPTSPGQ
ncbi:hypothetical protein [Azonexus sp.]|uniref:hypothetical protein n=1 Tax=Azonexus sp. TaxID=1872668 RepID=UPI0035B34F51